VSLRRLHGFPNGDGTMQSEGRRAVVQRPSGWYSCVSIVSFELCIDGMGGVTFAQMAPHLARKKSATANYNTLQKVPLLLKSVNFYMRGSADIRLCRETLRKINGKRIIRVSDFTSVKA
jgi:hypothetical protein